MANINPDELYLRSREDLIQYEDARFNSLIQALANFYSPENDQSIWGNFFRAIAMELARVEYFYSYNLVSKDPQYLTPPDIKRKYSDPLSISRSYPQDGQFDIGNLTTATPALQTPFGYRDMLVALLRAYEEGAVPQSIKDVIFAYTGKQIQVEELYKQITSNGFFDQSDRNSIKVSVNVGGNDPLTDIQNLNQLQQITNSLYGAIDLAKPAHVGLEFTTVFGTDENLDCALSPRFLTQFQLDTLTPTQQLYYVLIAYVLIEPTIGFQPQITITQYNALSTPDKALYQAYYNNLNCTGTGIDDTLRIIIQQVEQPPFDPMLIQAPILDKKNPKTTIAAWGRHVTNTLTASQWNGLWAIPTMWSNVTTYTRGKLVQGSDRNLYRAVKKNTGQDPTLTTPGVYWKVLPSPRVYQAYFTPDAGVTYKVGITQWAPSTAFYQGQFIIDPNGNLQTAATAGTSGAIRNISNVQLTSNVVTLTVNSTVGLGATVTPLGMTVATFLNGQRLIVTASTPTTIQASYTHANVASVASSGTLRTAFELATNATTTDGNVVWKCLGANYLNNPEKWIEVVDNTGIPTGEVSNWDIEHPMGLLAPREDLVWEISGGDTFKSYNMD